MSVTNSGAPRLIQQSGARESNAGDEFHVIWAMSRALSLLSPNTALELLVVEGLSRSDTRSVAASQLLGVDLTEYFGGESFKTAGSVVVSQLKYSHRHPDRGWTASRLAQKGSRGQSGVIGRLAEAYKGFRDAYQREQVVAKLAIALISNQPAAPALLGLLQKLSTNARCRGRATRSLLLNGLNESQRKDAERLIGASGLTLSLFRDFVLQFSIERLGSESRRSLEQRVIGELGRHLVGSAVASYRALFDLIRREALPEASEQLGLKRTDVLAHLGVSGNSAIFPLPPRIEPPSFTIATHDPDNVAAIINGGATRVVAHGDAGVGKTTMVELLEDRLPEGSVVIHFDCYGQGEYLSPAEPRHAVALAILEIVNELSLRTGSPLLLGEASEHQLWQRLRDVLVSSSNQVDGSHARIVIAIDAADNAATAGIERGQPTFLADLWRLPLPKSVHLLVTCRTHRMGSLELPATFTPIELAGFTVEGSTDHLRSRYPEASDADCQEFHKLSNGNPRVQFYSLERGSTAPERSLEGALQAAATTPAAIFEDLAVAALSESGTDSDGIALLANLISLARPVDLATFASASGVDEPRARGFVRALVPGVVVGGETVSFRDEDFETYLRGKVSSPALKESNARLGLYFLNRRAVDAYAAAACAEHLYKAELHNELISLAAEDGPPMAIPDPAARVQAYFRRLQLAMRLAEKPEWRPNAFKLAVLSARAASSNQAVADIVRRRPDLAHRYADPIAVQVVYENENSEPWRGPLHLQLSAIHAVNGNDSAAREQLNLANAWIKRWMSLERNERRDWHIEADDVAAGAEARFLLDGLDRAHETTKAWQPESFARKIGDRLIERLAQKRLITSDQILAAASQPLEKARELAAVLRSGQVVDPNRLREVVLAAVAEPLAGESALEPDPDPWEEGGDDWVVDFGEAVARFVRDPDLVASWCEAFRPRAPSSLPSQHEGIRDWDATLRHECLLRASRGEDLSASDMVPARLDHIEQPSSAQERRQNDERDKFIQAMNKHLASYMQRARALLSAPAVTSLVSPIDSEIKRFLSGRGSDYESPHSKTRSLFALADALVLCSGNASNQLRKISAAVGERQDLGIYSLLTLARRVLADDRYRGLAFTWLDSVATEVATSKWPATDRADVLLEVSGAVDPYDLALAANYYNASVAAADGLDNDGAAILKVHAVLAESIGASTPTFAPELATRVASAIIDFRPYVTDEDYLPWAETIHAVATLDPGVGLSTAAAWEHAGQMPLSRSISGVASAAVDRRYFDELTAIDLLQLGGSRDYPVSIAIDLLTRLIQRPDVSPALSTDCAEAVAQIICRDLSPAARLWAAPKIAKWAAENRMTGPFIDVCARITELSVTLPEHDDTRKEWSADPNEAIVRASRVQVIFAEAPDDNVSDVLSKVSELSHLYVENRQAADYLRVFAQHCSPAERVNFLELITSEASRRDLWQFSSSTSLPILQEILSGWAGFDPVKRWADSNIEDFVRARFIDFVNYSYSSPGTMASVFQLLGLKDAGATLITLLGPQLASLGADKLFSIAQGLVPSLGNDELPSALDWSLSSLEKSTPSHQGQGRPQPVVYAVPAFIWSLLGHADKAIRWRAAHTAVAIVAHTDGFLETVFDRYEATDFSKRTHDYPRFRALSALQWLLMVALRLASESPRSVLPVSRRLWNIAASGELPHASIRQLAKMTIEVLASSGLDLPAEVSPHELTFINMPKACVATKGYFSSGGRTDRRENARFHFDMMDILPYWYEPFGRVFGLGAEEVAERAEHWIVDVLAFSDDEVRTESKEKDSRYRWERTQNDHGSAAQVEDLRSYAQYHGLQLAAGALIDAGTPVLVSSYDDESDPWADWLEDHLPISGLRWMSELRSPAPVEAVTYRPFSNTSPRKPSAKDFDEQLWMDSSATRIVVDAHVDRSDTKQYEVASVTSALVSPATAHALMVALQTTKDSSNFRLPHERRETDDEIDHFEIDDDEFVLRGWLKEHYSERLGLEKHDAIRRIAPTYTSAGRKLLHSIAATSQFDHRDIYGVDGQRVSDVFAWSDEPDDNRSSTESYTSGEKTWVRLDDLLQFLSQVGMDAIVESRISRNRHTSTYNAREEGDDHEYDRGTSRIYLIRSHGTIETMDGIRAIGAGDNRAPGPG